MATEKPKSKIPPKPLPAKTPPSNPQSPRPYWVPKDAEYKKFPKRVQLALQAILQPAYDEYVLAAKNPMECSTGMTLVFVMWLELREQLRIGKDFQRDATLQPPAEDRQASIGNYLRLVGAKHKVSSFMLRLQEQRHQRANLGASDTALPRTTSQPPSDPAPAAPTQPGGTENGKS